MRLLARGEWITNRVSKRTTLNQVRRYEIVQSIASTGYLPAIRMCLVFVHAFDSGYVLLPIIRTHRTPEHVSVEHQTVILRALPFFTDRDRFVITNIVALVAIFGRQGVVDV